MRKLHPHQEIIGLQGLTIEDFWIWAYSDLLTDTVRNVFAEFVVGFTLGCLHKARVGHTPTVFDYCDQHVAVKAAAYVQSATQTRKSKISFDIRASKDSTRPAVNCYVFCLMTCENLDDKNTARNALIDIDCWRFYVLPADLLEKEAANKKTVGIRWLETHCPAGGIAYSQLKHEIDMTLGLLS